MKTTRERLDELIEQLNSEELIGDEVAWALEDLRDMWEGLEKAVEEIEKEFFSYAPEECITGNYDDVWQACADKCSEILRKHLPFLKDN